MNHILFVYGSLKQGFHNHNRCGLSQCMFLGYAKTADKFIMEDLGGYPAIFNPVEGLPSYEILGEMYDVPDYIYNPIRMMELGAGYAEAVIETVPRPHMGELYPAVHAFIKPGRPLGRLNPDGTWRKPKPAPYNYKFAT